MAFDHYDRSIHFGPRTLRSLVHIQSMRRIGVLNNPLKPPKGFNDEYDTHNFMDTALPSWIEGRPRSLVMNSWQDHSEKAI